MDKVRTEAWTTYEFCSKLARKTPEQPFFIVNFEQSSH